MNGPQDAPIPRPVLGVAARDDLGALGDRRRRVLRRRAQRAVDAARHGRFQEVRDMAAEGVHPDYYNDASVSWQRLKCTAFLSTAFSRPIGR